MYMILLMYGIRKTKHNSQIQRTDWWFPEGERYQWVGGIGAEVRTVIIK